MRIAEGRDRPMKSYDVAIVGAGILGLAHAYAAARRGQRVVVLERDAQANGASIRNFGFVTVTGQEAGDCWEMARRARRVWGELCAQARIPILQEGLVVAARLEESLPVLDAFLAGPMGEGCRRIGHAEAAAMIPALRPEAVRAALFSPHEVRVESREAIPRLAAFLAERLGVDFKWRTAVQAVETGRLWTSAGEIAAARIVVCPGDDFSSLFADRLQAYNLTRCKLHMLRLEPQRPVRFQTALMSDQGLGRYLGYADLPEATPLKARLDREFAALRANGVHLIVTQSADGSLVVGDSHHYAPTPDPFAPEAVDRLILDEFEAVLDLEGWSVRERWVGTYASAKDSWRLTDRPMDGVRIVIVTAGCGASTAFGIGEETIAALLD
ncbi:FAD dependent oxidoreductase TIGR03364 [Arboricoccus pini]|uniref:FAD dependent oxidoreductase TIGR03364 n=2 Tax=Arboricoccus pini TaxID=1963835 RepID=A0A212PY10_9PROT|nr:FAD dependent oxidoreductase TIGR03364 [Arboricoccus pini]